MIGKPELALATRSGTTWEISQSIATATRDTVVPEFGHEARDTAATFLECTRHTLCAVS